MSAPCLRHKDGEGAGPTHHPRHGHAAEQALPGGEERLRARVVSTKRFFGRAKSDLNSLRSIMGRAIPGGLVSE